MGLAGAEIQEQTSADDFWQRLWNTPCRGPKKPHLEHWRVVELLRWTQQTLKTPVPCECIENFWLLFFPKMTLSMIFSEEMSRYMIYRDYMYVCIYITMYIYIYIHIVFVFNRRIASMTDYAGVLVEWSNYHATQAHTSGAPCRLACCGQTAHSRKRCSLLE